MGKLAFLALGLCTLIALPKGKMGYHDPLQYFCAVANECYARLGKSNDMDNINGSRLSKGATK